MTGRPVGAGRRSDDSTGSLRCTIRLDLADIAPEQRRAAIWALEDLGAGAHVEIDVAQADPFDTGNHPGGLSDAVSALVEAGLHVDIEGDPDTLRSWLVVLYEAHGVNITPVYTTD